MANLSISAFAPFVAKLPAAVHPALTVAEWTTMSAISVMASLPRASRVAAVLAERGSRTHVLETGIGQWSVIREEGGLDDMASRLDGIAVTFDQSAASGILVIEGQDALPLLQKGVFVDLSRALDTHGACVVSVIAHVPVTLWRIASDRIGVVVPRSYAGSFWHWLEASAAAEAIPLATIG